MKKLIALLVALTLALSLTLAVSAAETGESVTMEYVIDVADQLYFDDWQELENRAKALSEQYQVGVYIVIVDDYTEYGSGDVFKVGTEIYSANYFGMGPGYDGIMLLMSMSDRDYTLVTYGKGSEAFTAYGTTLLEDAFLDNFRYDDWYGGYSDFISECENLLARWAAGDPADAEGYDSGYVSGYGADKTGPNPLAIAICFGVGLLVAGIFTGINAAKMNTAREATGASQYVVANSLNVYNRQDIFTHITQTRRKIETESSRSGGGGGAHGGGGFSGRSGKF